MSALLWPAGLVLLTLLLAVLLAALLIRRAGVVTVLAALLAGALPAAGYSAWFSSRAHQFSLTRSDKVYLWSRTMSFADRYQFADAATAWVPAGMRTPGGGTVAGDQAFVQPRAPGADPGRCRRTPGGW